MSAFLLDLYIYYEKIHRSIVKQVNHMEISRQVFEYLVLATDDLEVTYSFTNSEECAPPGPYHINKDIPELLA